MENPERYLRFVREAERLKDTLRSAHTSQGRHESTAEHSWRLALLALAVWQTGMMGLEFIPEMSAAQMSIRCACDLDAGMRTRPVRAPGMMVLFIG